MTNRVNEPALPRQLQARYGVGPRFAAAYWDYWTQPYGRQAGRTFASVDEALAVPAPDAGWLDHALSTNRHAALLRDVLLARHDVRGRRVLDVGCGFGGRLVAFAARGFDVRGLSADPTRAELARANCADHGLTDVITEVGAIDAALRERLGAFDLVTLVEDGEYPRDAQVLAEVTRMLSPEGVLVLEVFNRHYLPFVAADGHFGLFGLTLLDAADATAYRDERAPWPSDATLSADAGELRDHLVALGFDVELGPGARARSTMDDVPGLIRSIRTAFERYCHERRAHVAPAIDARLQLRVAGFLARLADDYAGARTPERTATFRARYLTPACLLVARAAVTGHAQASATMPGRSA